MDSSSSSSKGVLIQPWAAAKVHRKFPLLQPTLAGLGRYSHLISVDYFNDLMAVLQEVRGGGAATLSIACSAWPLVVVMDGCTDPVIEYDTPDPISLLCHTLNPQHQN
jgi:hypothetical protein